MSDMSIAASLFSITSAFQGKWVVNAIVKSGPQVFLSLHENYSKPPDAPHASPINKRPLQFARENHITPKHPQNDSVCHFKSHTKPLETAESHGFRHSRWLSMSLKMTPEACCFGGVLTWGLLKETEENCIPNCIPRMPIYIGLKDSYVAKVVGFNNWPDAFLRKLTFLLGTNLTTEYRTRDDIATILSHLWRQGLCAIDILRKVIRTTHQRHCLEVRAIRAPR